ncbi:hypothetical protein DFJ74DRAFT_736744 [Hyaloraphidium curvatum]|nr:hypothetical protein DFJ74DRAFT_736744 [Hyaloraphidium curvatum]
MTTPSVVKRSRQPPTPYWIAPKSGDALELPAPATAVKSEDHPNSSRRKKLAEIYPEMPDSPAKNDGSPPAPRRRLQKRKRGDAASTDQVDGVPAAAQESSPNRPGRRGRNGSESSASSPSDPLVGGKGSAPPSKRSRHSAAPTPTKAAPTRAAQRQPARPPAPESDIVGETPQRPRSQSVSFGPVTERIIPQRGDEQEHADEEDEEDDDEITRFAHGRGRLFGDAEQRGERSAETIAEPASPSLLDGMVLTLRRDPHPEYRARFADPKSTPGSAGPGSSRAATGRPTPIRATASPDSASSGGGTPQPDTAGTAFSSPGASGDDSPPRPADASITVPGFSAYSSALLRLAEGREEFHRRQLGYLSAQLADSQRRSARWEARAREALRGLEVAVAKAEGLERELQGAKGAQGRVGELERELEAVRAELEEEKRRSEAERQKMWDRVRKAVMLEAEG